MPRGWHVASIFCVLPHGSSQWPYDLVLTGIILSWQRRKLRHGVLHWACRAGTHTDGLLQCSCPWPQPAHLSPNTWYLYNHCVTKTQTPPNQQTLQSETPGHLSLEGPLMLFLNASVGSGPLGQCKNLEARSFFPCSFPRGHMHPLGAGRASEVQPWLSLALHGTSKDSFSCPWLLLVTAGSFFII